MPPADEWYEIRDERQLTWHKPVGILITFKDSKAQFRVSALNNHNSCLRGLNFLVFPTDLVESIAFICYNLRRKLYEQ